VNLFLDTSVLLAACGSTAGASREIFRRASLNGWILISTPYVIDEVLKNLARLPSSATAEWRSIVGQLLILGDVLTVDKPVVFSPAKDKPILFAALAWAEVLLTLDQHDFGRLMDGSFYGLRVIRPGQFLEAVRSEGTLR
jgi:predicted nucleic acid-binding protein